MTILITASTFPRWPDDSVPNFVFDQAVALKRLYPDVPIHILAPHHLGAELDECWDDIHIHRFKYLFPTKWQKLVYPAIHPNIRHNKWLILQVPFLFLAQFFALCSLIRKLRPSIVYSHWFTPQGIVGGAACALFKVPHVFTSHSSDTQILRKVPLLGPAVLRFFVRRADACTVVSRRSFSKLRAFFTSSEWPSIERKVKIIPMGIDLDSLEPDFKAPSEGCGGVTKILFMGRLSEKKGITYLLKAFSNVSLDSEAHTLELWIAGDGELMPQIRQEIRALGLEESVKMLGYVSGKQKLERIAAADILVVPSIITDDGDAEGLPVSLMEGLAAAKLCIATDVSGADEVLVNGKNGYLIQQKDYVSLAKALSSCLSLSGIAAEKMRCQALETAKRFDWEAIAKQHKQHLFDRLF